jgi:hypothetical protein
MSFESLVTHKLGIPYFAAGGTYSAEADRRRFLYLDYNQASYIGIIGVGLIDGWSVTSAGGLNVAVDYGTAVLNEAFCESPFVVKNRVDVLPTDYVIDQNYYIQLPPNGEPPPLVYDPEFYPTPPDPVDVTAVFDKVLYQPLVELNDDSDNYVYIYRNSASTQDNPYYVPDNDNPVAEDAPSFNALHTAVAFGVTASLAFAQSSGKSLLAKVVTRSGQVVSIDSSQVTSIKNLEASILAFGQKMINGHRHNGTNQFDPEAINLATDRRKTILDSSNEQSITYRILYYIPSSIKLGHKHFYFVDSSGNGYTATTVGAQGNAHYHVISNYLVQSAKYPTGGEDHTHTIFLSAESPDSWKSSEDYVIYINGVAYTGSNVSVDFVNKKVTFTDDVTVVKRSYIVQKDSYTFQHDDTTVYRFMLRMALDYYAKNVDAISNGTLQPIILPDPATPVTDLKNQCVVAEEFLTKTGDFFTFVGSVAPDPNNVIVTLIEAGHVDSIEIEITANSEVTGKLREQNILYIPADKFLTGTFDIGRIPIISHSFRYLEHCNFKSERMYSYDGYTFQVPSPNAWGNFKNIYSTYVDDQQNILIGTSDGMYSYPVDGAYIFVINGQKIITSYGDLYERLSEACSEYATASGVPFVFNEQLYRQQVIDAEPRLSTNGSEVVMRGYYNVSKTSSYFDIIYVYYVDGYKLPNFGYTATKSQEEMLEGEEIVKAKGSLYDVKNDFNRSTIKKILVEKNLGDQYGGASRLYYALSSDFFAKSANITKAWALGYQSGLIGYMSDFFRTYKGYYVIYGLNGIYVCTNSSSSEYKKMKSPKYYTEINSASFGYGDRILISYHNFVYFTDNYGKTWTQSNLPESKYVQLFFDPSQDITGVTDLHYHNIVLDVYGMGYTEGVFDLSGDPIVGDFHYHSISKGVIQEASGHVHSAVRTFYALDENGLIYSSLDGLTWSFYARIPSNIDEHGPVFAAFKYIFVATETGLKKTSDGSSWTLDLAFEGKVLSANWDENNQTMYLGGEGLLYSYDGSEFLTILSLDGVIKPSVYVNGVKKNFGYYTNNLKRKVDFYGDDLTKKSVAAVYDFSKCYTQNGGWSNRSGYSLYINDKLVKASQMKFDLLGNSYMEVVGSDAQAYVSNTGYIDFGVSTTSDGISYGDVYLQVKDQAGFGQGGYVGVLLPANTKAKTLSQYVILEYTSVADNRLYLRYASQYEIKGSCIVTLLSTVGFGDNVLITIGESKFPGISDHYSIEDRLSTKNIGLPKSLADVYLANLSHLTIAIKYAISSVGSDYVNYFLSLFDYNDIPGDENNINRFIDIPNSNLYSQLRFASTFYPFVASKIYRIIFGFGIFENVLFVATDMGLYTLKTIDGYDANWFRVNVNGTSVAYDFLQAKNDMVIVITEEGMFRSSDGKTWTKYNNEVIGGMPIKISPRWTEIEDYSNGEYWWQHWNGVINENESLTNSLIISGPDFCSITDDYGKTWHKAMFPYSQFFMGDVSLMHNGSILSVLKPLGGESASIIISANSGSVWGNKYTFFGYSGSITGYTTTKDSNVVLSVKYTNIEPTFAILRGCKIFLNKMKFDVIDNYSDKIVILGTGIVDFINVSADSAGSFGAIAISPIMPNMVCELPQNNLLIGTDNGIFVDSVSLGGPGSDTVIIKDIGVKATVTSLNIVGSVITTIFSNSEKALVSVQLDKIVKSNELKGLFLRTPGYKDREILNNDNTSIDGLTNLYLKYQDPDIQVNTNFTILSVSGDKNTVEKNRIYVNFDSYVVPGELVGGFLYLKPEALDTIPEFSGIIEFSVQSNGFDYIDFIAVDPDLLSSNSIDMSDLMKAGTVVVSTLSNGKVPVYVEMVNKPAPGTLKNRTCQIQNVSSNIEKLDLVIQDNNENVFYFDKTVMCRVKNSDGSTSTTPSTFSTYSCVLENFTIVFVTSLFSSDKTFNYSKSTVQNDHYHDVSIYSKATTGTIVSILASTASYVDFEISGADQLLDPPFVHDSSLLSGQRMVVYDPNNYSSTFVLEIIETTNLRMRVKNSGDIFDFSMTDNRKISSGYYLYIDTSYYGFSSEPVFTKDFLIKKEFLSDDLFLQGTLITVPDTSYFHIGGRVNLRDRGGAKTTTVITSIVSPTVLEIQDQSPFDYLVKNNAYIEYLYTKLPVLSTSLTSDSALGVYSVTISDTSSVNSGDFVKLSDNKGLLFTSTVSSIISSSTFTVYDKISADYTVSNSASCSITRSNYINNHSHIIKNGEFSVSSNYYWNIVGYSYYHSHTISPLIKEISDIKVIHGKTYVVGNDTKIYSSKNSGLTWEEEVDLSDITTLGTVPGVVQSIATNGYDILFGTDSGGLVYYTSKASSGIVPLEQPIT